MDENVQNTAKIMYSQLTFFRWERIFLLGLGVLQLPFIELGYLGHVWFVTHFRLELWKNIFIRNGWMKFERNTLSVQTNVGLTWLPWEKFAAQQTMNRSLWSLDKVKPLQFLPLGSLFIGHVNQTWNTWYQRCQKARCQLRQEEFLKWIHGPCSYKGVLFVTTSI